MSAGRTSIRKRLEALDWKAIEESLWELGYAKTPSLLTPQECESLIRLYPDDSKFRSRIDMERYRFGVGDYAYFARPLPKLVQELRTHAYRRLAPIANRWAELLGNKDKFPPSHRSFLETCHARGQMRPTPLLLHYQENGYNCLHQDLYGTLAFPLQLTVFLSRPGRDS